MDYGSWLVRLGISITKETSDYYEFRSPFRVDETPSMVTYKGSGVTVDFARPYRVPFPKFYFDMTGKVFEEEISQDIFFQKATPTRSGVRKEISVELDFEGVAVPALESPEALSYCYKRHMTDDFINEFKLMQTKFCRIKGKREGDERPGTPFINRLLVPIEENGSIVSIEGRDLTGTAEKKCIYPRGCTVDTLFNIDKLDRKKPLIVVEGIMDLVQIYLNLTTNVTAVFGASVTNRQWYLLNQFDDVVVFQDNDEAGDLMVDEFYKKYDKDFTVAQVPEKDPGDSNPANILKAFNERKLYNELRIEGSGLFEPISSTIW
jgi:5S rRNA maturation endonuclease (ribonuclease M5)